MKLMIRYCSTLACSLAMLIPTHAYAQGFRNIEDGKYCISGPDIKYDPTTDWNSAVFENDCSFGIVIDYSYTTNGKFIKTNRTVSAYSKASFLILKADSISYSERPKGGY